MQSDPKQLARGKVSFRASDRRRVAVASLVVQWVWRMSVLPSSPEQGSRESPLHLAVRWGLYRLAELLLCQPGGLMAVNMPNDEGVSPLQLAQTGGNAKLLELLKQWDNRRDDPSWICIPTMNLTRSLWLSPPNPLATPPAGLSQVWANRSHLLRFCHDTENLTLTVRQNLRWASEERRRSDILLLRERLRDEDFLREVGLVWVILNGCVLSVNNKKLLLTEHYLDNFNYEMVLSRRILHNFLNYSSLNELT